MSSSFRAGKRSKMFFLIVVEAIVHIIIHILGRMCPSSGLIFLFHIFQDKKVQLQLFHGFNFEIFPFDCYSNKT